MQFIYLFCFALFAALSSKAAPNENARDKRALSYELCPDNSIEDCSAYAEKKSQKLKFCHTYEVEQGHIHWQGCGRVYCGENTKLIKQDLSRSYPDCCEYCKIIDDTKKLLFPVPCGNKSTYLMRCTVVYSPRNRRRVYVGASDFTAGD